MCNPQGIYVTEDFRFDAGRSLVCMCVRACVSVYILYVCVSKCVCVLSGFLIKAGQITRSEDPPGGREPRMLQSVIPEATRDKAEHSDSLMRLRFCAWATGNAETPQSDVFKALILFPFEGS